MKFTWLSAVLVSIGLPVAAQSITIDPKSLQPMRPLTAKDVNPGLVRSACIQAVRHEESPTKRIEVLDASVVPTKDEHSAFCVVSAKVMEGMGLYASSGSYTTTDVRYSGKLNLETGNVELARIDEDAAKQVALNALAAMFINLKPAAMAENKIAYTASIAGKKCLVEVANDASPEPKRWLVTKLDCKR
ncbi:hypothetical protein C5468_21345 [Photorhabdus luminescens subsp. mexicana]|uniref:Uncharacterized protein n=2 Tax=Photorhabdus luminescens TaxID=29488 RepID=A0A4V2X4R1_PHOLU|nr:hypothetical protein C5468_21345 [Photorhabdus luminescens subsp. mexicana]